MITTELMWGTYGYEGDQPLVYKPLHELDDDHLCNILMTQDHMGTQFVVVICQILEERGVDWKPCLVDQEKREAARTAFMQRFTKGQRRLKNGKEPNTAGQSTQARTGQHESCTNSGCL